MIPNSILLNFFYFLIPDSYLFFGVSLFYLDFCDKSKFTSILKNALVGSFLSNMPSISLGFSALPSTSLSCCISSSPHRPRFISRPAYPFFVYPLIIFILDASETCGYSLKDQTHLLSQIKKMFSDSLITVVENKIDFKMTVSTNLKISCKTGEGIDSLIKNIFSNCRPKDIDE